MVVKNRKIYIVERLRVLIIRFDDTKFRGELMTDENLDNKVNVSNDNASNTIANVRTQIDAFIDSVQENYPTMRTGVFEKTLLEKTMAFVGFEATSDEFYLTRTYPIANKLQKTHSAEITRMSDVLTAGVNELYTKLEQSRKDAAQNSLTGDDRKAAQDIVRQDSLNYAYLAELKLNFNKIFDAGWANGQTPVTSTHIDHTSLYGRIVNYLAIKRAGQLSYKDQLKEERALADMGYNMYVNAGKAVEVATEQLANSVPVSEAEMGAFVDRCNALNKDYEN
jgi:hypothetical protein